ncbi:unnamed protein product [Sphagnum jensenii]|uniref:Uncharacterized protein n=1 Tax=Sphagnum jensenii TaxID=128206 RepID=A0ABP1AK82_9BRYO
MDRSPEYRGQQQPQQLRSSPLANLTEYYANNEQFIDKNDKLTTNFGGEFAVGGIRVQQPKLRAILEQSSNNFSSISSNSRTTLCQ